MSIEAMKQALDALGAYMSATDSEEDEKAHSLMATAFFKLKEAIAEAEKQEPVAMQMDVIVVNLVREGINKHRARELAEHFIKHTHPQPKREPLTDEQIAEFFGVKAVDESFVDFVRAIEAAHGIKE